MEHSIETIPVGGKKRHFKPHELPQPGDIFISSVNRTNSPTDNLTRLEVNVVTGNDAVPHGGLTDMVIVELEQFNQEPIHLTLTSCKLEHSLFVVKTIHDNLHRIFSTNKLGWLEKPKQLPSGNDIEV
jgi:hypothetical protein